MQTEVQTENKLLKCILDAGELILKSGGEVNRVEDTMRRLCRAYGFVRADVFTITSSIIVTVHTAGGDILTQTRRISGYDMNLERVHRMNQLAREICSSPLEVQELEQAIARIRDLPERPLHRKALLGGFTSAVFAVFFGGGIPEALLGGITGVLLCVMLSLLSQLLTNEIVRYAVCSAIGGLFLGLLQKCGIQYLVDPTLMGNIMLLIPGIPFTNSIRDMLSGDTMSGMLRMCESLLRTIAIAAGFAGMLALLGGIGG